MSAALQAVARAICRGGRGLVRLLVRTRPELAAYVADDGRDVTLSDARAFSVALAAAKFAEAGGQATGTKGGAGVRDGRFGRGWRLAQLWAPLDRRLILRGVRVRQPTEVGEEVARAAADMASELRDVWSPVFKRKPEQPEAGAAMLREHGAD